MFITKTKVLSFGTHFVIVTPIVFQEYFFAKKPWKYTVLNVEGIKWRILLSSICSVFISPDAIFIENIVEILLRDVRRGDTYPVIQNSYDTYGTSVFHYPLSPIPYIGWFMHYNKNGNILNMSGMINWLLSTLWSYYYGNLGFITNSGVIVKLPSNKGWQKWELSNMFASRLHPLVNYLCVVLPKRT